MTGLRERKKAATRAALAEAALSLCLENGIDAVTVEQVANVAGVSLRTFFNYFSSKEEAVVAGDMATAAAVVSAFAERPADEPVLDALGASLRSVLPEDIDRTKVEQLRELRLSPSVLPHLLAAYGAREQELTAAVAERTGVDPAADPYPQMLAAAALATLRAIMQWWLEGDGEQRPAELVDRMIAQLAAGFTRPS